MAAIFTRRANLFVQVGLALLVLGGLSFLRLHIAKGVGCTECHGPIGNMPLTDKATTLCMSWRLDCHRHPATHLRPRNAVFDPHWYRSASNTSA